jgi:DNA/RNA-binding domain of Phe-tRNA-synthetase-like protein
MPLTLSSEVHPHVALGAAWFERLRVVDAEPRLDDPLAQAARRMCERGPAEEAIAAVRAMYRRFGVDPTKTRPSSEALLRRVRKGDPLPRINSLVDIVNWCSLELQLPYGLYDLERITPPFELRVGQPGEAYAGIRKDEVHLAGRLTLADAEGAFGNPTSDSFRARVTPATARALVAIYAPRSREHELTAALDLTSERVAAYAAGHEVGRSIL